MKKSVSRISEFFLPFNVNAIPFDYTESNLFFVQLCTQNFYKNILSFTDLFISLYLHL